MKRPYRVEAMIPMRGKWELTDSLVTALWDQDEFDTLLIYDNGSDDDGSRVWLEAVEHEQIFGPDVRVIWWGPSRGIYRMWNDAWRRSLANWSLDHRPVYLAILNNDIMVPDGFLGELANALYNADDDVWITYPEWKMGWPAEKNVTGRLIKTRGTRNPGGMSGFAFMLDVRRHVIDGLPFIDERYIWYSGDGELITNIQDRGACAAAVEGLPIGHLERATAKDTDWAIPQGHADMRRWRRLFKRRYDT